MNNIDRFQFRKGRILVVNGIKWKWTIGKNGGVVAYSETGEHRIQQTWIIKGISFDSWDRGQWKRTREGMLKPSQVANWLAK